MKIHKYYPLPWTFKESQGSHGPVIIDANGNAVAALYWPVHPPEEESEAVEAVTELGESIAHSNSMAEVIALLEQSAEPFDRACMILRKAKGAA